MAGMLYLVGTPIGNLQDVSPRCIETLQKVDLVAAEDTRVAGKLLSLFGLHKPLFSYHEHNKKENGGKLLERLLAGEQIALVTDAGLPAISDPGEDLVALCAAHNLPVTIIPGPCACVSALTVSGLPTARFSFEGFLSTSRGSRKAHLDSLKQDTHTLIFYEAPHKLQRTLDDLFTAFGNRRISLVRELTKLHEEIIRTDLAHAVSLYTETNPPRGEYVLILEGAAPPEQQDQADSALLLARELLQSGLSVNQAAKEAAKQTGYSKNKLYQLLLTAEESPSAED